MFLKHCKHCNHYLSITVILWNTMLATNSKIITRLNFHAFWTKEIFQFLSDRNFIKTWLNYGYCFKNTLNKQHFLLCHILKVCPVKVINMWWALTKRLPHQTYLTFVGKHWFYVCLTNTIFITGRLQKTIYAIFATICKHNYMCFHIVKNAWIDTFGVCVK